MVYSPGPAKLDVGGAPGLAEGDLRLTKGVKRSSIQTDVALERLEQEFAFVRGELEISWHLDKKEEGGSHNSLSLSLCS